MSASFIVIPFDETILQLPSCLTLHAKLRSHLNHLIRTDYVNLMQQLDHVHIYGVISQNNIDKMVVALAVCRMFFNTFDTVCFQIDDFIVDENQRRKGLGSYLFNYLVQQAKLLNATHIRVQCDLTNVDAHGFLFHLGFVITTFEFDLRNKQILESNNQIRLIDITDLNEHDNEQLLLRAHAVHRQLRPHLSCDESMYVNQIQEICRTGSVRVIVAIKNDDKSEILGLTIYRITSNINYAKHIYCDDLVTNERYRSLGVGRCLINYMKNEGKNLGIERLVLDSGCQRTRAHRFYHREGFIISRFGFCYNFQA